MNFHLFIYLLDFNYSDCSEHDKRWYGLYMFAMSIHEFRLMLQDGYFQIFQPTYS